MSQIIDTNEAKMLGAEIGENGIPEILQSAENLKGFIDNNLILIKTMIATGESNKKETTQELKKDLLILFQNMIQLRTYFTGEQYELMVGLENGNTIRVPMLELFDQQGILIKENQIEYSLTNLKHNYEIIDKYNTLYQQLTQELFPEHCLNSGIPFVYQHTKGDHVSQGDFFNIHGQEGFAHYKTQATYHFYIKQKQIQKSFYTKQNAKFYNEGHVYEWFLDDINNDVIKENKKVQMYSFMASHEKDNVPFMRAGDITRKKDNIIYAVQVKKINNKKLITYKQIRTVLNKLKGLTSKRLTKEKATHIIQNAFLQKDLNKIDQATLKRVEISVDGLCKKLNIVN